MLGLGDRGVFYLKDMIFLKAKIDSVYVQSESWSTFSVYCHIENILYNSKVDVPFNIFM